jgi:hypothetical protein
MLFVFSLSASFAAEQSGFTDGISVQQGIRLIKRGLDNGAMTKQEEKEAYFAMGYFAGFMGQTAIWAKIDRVCPIRLPENAISALQLIEITDKYLSAHPDQLHESAELLIYLALMDSFGDPRYPKLQEKAATPETSPR